jgi:hypothetical protein
MTARTGPGPRPRLFVVATWFDTLGHRRPSTSDCEHLEA